MNLGRQASHKPPDLPGWLGQVSVGETTRIGDLELAPLCLDKPPTEPAYLLSDEAIHSGALEITELDEGVVQELLAHNHGPKPVLILEGDTLVGCKQNRVVAHTLMVAAAASVKIPVGCMEEGRWEHTSATFRTGGLRMEPSLRQASVSETASRRRAGAPVALDQGRLWGHVAERLESSGTSSHTGDYHELIESRGEEARRSTAQIETAPNQVGVLALQGGRLLGLELTAHPRTWKAVSDRTLPSYVLAAQTGPTEGKKRRKTTRKSAEAWLKTLRSGRAKTHKALDLGLDLELEAPGILGAGLWYDNEPAHLAVFAAQ